MDFRTLPTGPFTLTNATLPGSARGDLAVADGKIAADQVGETIDLAGRMVLPLFTDMHTHLDKGHIWNRKPNPDGTFDGALNSVGEDRLARWSAHDVERRMQFALRSAYAHGTGGIRTHLDSLGPQDDISWPVFRKVRDEWRGRVDLQAVCLVAIDDVDEGGPFRHTADIVAESGGVLGAVVYPVEGVNERLETFFAMAGARDLSADFHVDETGDPAAAGLRAIAETVIRTGFDAPVVVGHCCSLAMQDDSEADRTMDLVAKAGLNVVSLPMCNMYLQARQTRRTPRWRGITLVHEMRERGTSISFASDNTRDPFYAYGDLDMLEVMREATRIAHLDHSHEDWMTSFAENPAAVCGFAVRRLAAGDPADFIIFNARNINELLSRPQSDRIVVRAGSAIDRTLPDYSELDDLMEVS